MKSLIICIFLILIILLGVAIGTQNNATVEINYLIARSQISVSLLIAICFAIGFLAAWLLSGLLYLRLLFSKSVLKLKMANQSKSLIKKDNHIKKLQHQNTTDADFLLTQNTTNTRKE